MLLDAVYTWEFNILLKLLDDKFTNEMYFIISKIITSSVVYKFISLADIVTITGKLLATVGKFLIYIFSNSCFGHHFESYFSYLIVSNTLESGIIRWYFNFLFVQYDCKEGPRYTIYCQIYQIYDHNKSGITKTNWHRIKFLSG